MSNKDALYAEFLESFPNFKLIVKRYFQHGDNAIKIYTKYGKKFIFEKTETGIEFRSA